MDRLEREHIDAKLPVHMRNTLREVTDTDWAVVEMFDRAEFCIGMIRERMLGNRYTEIYYKRAWDKMTQVLEKNRQEFYARDPELWEGIVAMRRDIAAAWVEARDDKFDIHTKLKGDSSNAR